MSRREVIMMTSISILSTYVFSIYKVAKLFSLSYDILDLK
jgi:uncharacterized membrane protein